MCFNPPSFWLKGEGGEKGDDHELTDFLILPWDSVSSILTPCTHPPPCVLCECRGSARRTKEVKSMEVVLPADPLRFVTCVAP